MTSRGKEDAKQIVVVDTVCHGLEHVPFNSAMLQTISSAFPDAAISFYAQFDHLNAVRHAVAFPLNNMINFQAANVAERKLKGRERTAQDITLFQNIISDDDPSSIDQLVLLASRHESLRSLRNLLRKLLPAARVVHVMHGGAAKIKRRRRNPFTWLSDARASIRSTCCTPWMHLFLEEAVRKEAVSVIPRLGGYSSVLEHPLPPDARLHCATSIEPLKVGFLGACTRAKGFNTFLECARIAGEKWQGRFEFHAIGSLKGTAEDERLRCLATEPADQKIGREEFRKKLTALHYVFLPYSSSHYASSPSGVLLDSIGFGKPLVCTDVPLFDDFFRKYGNIGFQRPQSDSWCDEVLAALSQVSNQTYAAQCANVSRAFADRTCENLAKKYRHIVTN